MKAIGIIGYHHTGKTTLATHLIAALVDRGMRVSSIKDIHNDAYRADTESSNSWKHARAGAHQVFAKGLHDSALIITPPPDLKGILPFLDCDWLVIEGMKDAAVPKIVCAQSEEQLEELIDATCIGISGPIASRMKDYRSLPVFCLEKDSDALLDTVLRHCFPILPQSDPQCCSACGKTCHQMAADILSGVSSREDCVLDGKPELRLWVNGREVTIVPFVQNIIRDSVRALVGNLKGVDADGSIRLEITGK
jgi:molybdopterin-guanine dinucleotide biosynthesis protein B